MIQTMTEHRLINLDQLARDRGSHSSFGPSSSAMWLNCPGSLLPNLMAPDDAGPDAAYGTVAHSVTETWLKTGKRPSHLIGTNEFVESGDWGFLVEIDEVMLDHAQTCVDTVALLPGDHFIERKVDFSRITPIPRQRGTADFVGCEPGLLRVKDWKFGKGVPVYAKYAEFDDMTFAPWMINSQLALYALGTYFEFDDEYRFEQIEIEVVQPRLDHIDSVTISRAQLLEFADWAKPRAHAAWQLNAPRTPGIKQCTWCKVKTDCAPAAMFAAELTAGAFPDLDAEITPADVAAFKDDLDTTAEPRLGDVMRLSTADLAQLYTWRKFVESWWKSLEIELLRRSARGENVPGMKIVESRSRRVFRFPRDAGDKLVSYGVPSEKVFVETVPSPAEAEKLLRKAGYRTKELPELLDGLLFKPPGKPTLAPLYDKRPALVDVTAAAFGDLTEDDQSEDWD